ncbi:hypothetical protein SLS56_000711 [Neofusicoccum ribis]|uniref:CCHC-type domain-containing protein n=1 Tax=Neofusicoccum ribis TaxID=45134 RepID=A0ABR3TDB4_9PEZI
MMRGGGGIRGVYVALDSNPYQRHKEVIARITLCETCDRKIETKDWNAHQSGKKHQKAAQELRQAKNAEKNDNTNTSWGDEVNDAAQQQEHSSGHDDGFFNSAPTKAKGGGGGSGWCFSFSCGEVGHRKAECPNGGGRPCYNCGEFGHIKSECTNPSQGGGGGGRPCYNCGEVGHLKSECTNPRQAGAGGDRPCFKCGQVGHISKDCNFCENCGIEGHSFFQCELKKDFSKITCTVCKQKGHTKKKCPQAQQSESGEFSGGFGDSGFGGGFDTTAAPASGGWDTAGGSGGGSWDVNGGGNTGGAAPSNGWADSSWQDNAGGGGDVSGGW